MFESIYFKMYDFYDYPRTYKNNININPNIPR